MKIGIDARFYGLEHAGLGRYCLNLIHQLTRIDKKNHYILFLRKAYFNKLNLPSNFTQVLADIGHYTLKEQISLPQIYSKQNLDLLHVPHFNVPIFYPKKFILTIHDLLWHEKKGARVTTLNPIFYYLKYGGYRLTIRFALSRASKIIVPSHWVKQQVQKRFDLSNSKIAVIYEGVEPTYQKSKLTRKSNFLSKLKVSQPFIIYTGSLYPHKNISRLIKAVKNINIENKLKLMLVIVCAREDAFSQKLSQLVKKLNATDLIIFAGFLSDEKIVQLYQHAACLVHPSFSEGFGLTGLEAMATGLPVIAAKTAALPEIYADAALYIDPNNIGDIQEKIVQLIKSKELRKEQIEKGRKRIKKFSWQHMVESTAQVYQET